MEPTIEAIESKGIKVTRIDIDRYPKLAARFNIKAVPTLVFIDGTTEKYRAEGLISLATLLKILKILKFLFG